jgi:hypothetical protein
MIFRNNKIFEYYIMTRKLSDWNIFVKKVYAEGKAKNSNYEFKQALEDASKRKSEMKHSSHTASGVRQTKTGKKSRRGRRRSAYASLAGGKTRRRHSRHHRR